MSLGDSNELVVARQVQWQRVKGELRALIYGWYYDPEDHAKKLEKLSNEFIKEVEDNELYV